MGHLAHDPNKKADNLTTMQLGDVLPANVSVKDGHLTIAGVDTVWLADTYGTALYVYDEDHIRTQIRTYIKKMREYLPSADVAYACKAFTCKAMVKLIDEENGWLDVSSGGELAIAIAGGFPAKHIIVHGNNKTMRELSEAVDADAGCIVVDCFEELKRVNEIAGTKGKCQQILLRIKPGIVADTHEFIRTGAEDSKFGFGIADGLATAAIKEAMTLQNVALKGLHVHIGSQIFALDSFVELAKTMAAYLASLRDDLGFVAEKLDLGGGLGIAYLADDKPTSIAEFAQTVGNAIVKACEYYNISVPHVLIEPGRSVIANAGVTLYTVGSVKELTGIRTYVSIDGGMTDNIRTALYGAQYESIVANKADLPRNKVVTLAGKHCESGDVVAVDVSLQNPDPGDTVCMFVTGAYCQSMASNYNRQVRPGVVFVQDGQVREVMRREDYRDLMATDML